MAFIEPMHRNKPNITYLQEIKMLIVLQKIFIQSTTCTFWTVMYRCLYEDPAICLIFVAGTVG